MLTCHHAESSERNHQKYSSLVNHVVVDPTLFYLSEAVVPDFDFVFNRWYTINIIYIDRKKDEVLHFDTPQIIEVAKSKRVLSDIVGMEIHNEQDNKGHPLIHENMEVLRDELSDQLKRDVSEEETESIIESGAEGKVIKRDPYIRERMLKALRHGKRYSEDLAEVLSEVYKEYKIKPRSFRRAIFVGNLFGRIRLMSEKYTKYIPEKNGKRKLRFSFPEIIFYRMLEYFDSIERIDTYLEKSRVVQKLLSEGYKEKIPLPRFHTKRVINELLTSI